MLLTVLQFLLSAPQLAQELLELCLGEHFLCKDKRSETIESQVLALLKQRGAAASLDLFFYDSLGSLNVVNDLARLLRLDKDAHLL